MSGQWREALRDHWQSWTCLRGWGRILCVLDTICHEWLHLPYWLMAPLCDLHDGRLMRTMGDENDLHDATIQRWWNTSTATTTISGDVKVTYKARP